MSLNNHVGERPKHSSVSAKCLSEYEYNYNGVLYVWGFYEGMKYAHTHYGTYWVSWYLCNPAVLAPSFSSLALLALATFHLPYGATAWETPSLRICENPPILMETHPLWSFRWTLLKLFKRCGRNISHPTKWGHSIEDTLLLPLYMWKTTDESHHGLKAKQYAKSLCRQKRIYYKKTCDIYSFV